VKQYICGLTTLPLAMFATDRETGLKASMVGRCRGRIVFCIRLNNVYGHSFGSGIFVRQAVAYKEAKASQVLGVKDDGDDTLVKRS